MKSVSTAFYGSNAANLEEETWGCTVRCCDRDSGALMPLTRGVFRRLPK